MQSSRIINPQLAQLLSQKDVLLNKGSSSPNFISGTKDLATDFIVLGIELKEADFLQNIEDIKECYESAIALSQKIEDRNGSLTMMIINTYINLSDLILTRDHAINQHNFKLIKNYISSVCKLLENHNALSHFISINEFPIFHKIMNSLSILTDELSDFDNKISIDCYMDISKIYHDAMTLEVDTPIVMNEILKINDKIMLCLNDQVESVTNENQSYQTILSDILELSKTTVCTDKQTKDDDIFHPNTYLLVCNKLTSKSETIQTPNAYLESAFVLSATLSQLGILFETQNRHLSNTCLNLAINIYNNIIARDLTGFSAYKKCSEFDHVIDYGIPNLTRNKLAAALKKLQVLYIQIALLDVEQENQSHQTILNHCEQRFKLIVDAIMIIDHDMVKMFVKSSYLNLQAKNLNYLLDSITPLLEQLTLKQTSEFLEKDNLCMPKHGINQNEVRTLFYLEDVDDVKRHLFTLFKSNKIANDANVNPEVEINSSRRTT